jgi:hypothetical protein
MQRKALRAFSYLLVIFALVGCTSASQVTALRQRTQAAVGGTATPVAQQASPTSPAAAPTATDVPATSEPDTSAAPTAEPPTAVPPTATSAPATPTTAPAANDATALTATPAPAQVEAAIKAVIQKGNQEQVNAFAKSNPRLMQDTATTDYYNKLVSINQQLTDGGVSAIKLLKLEWGPISLTTPNAGNPTATAMTWETWQTNYSDGSTDQSRDRNVYTMVFQAGAWLILDDQHPDSGLDQPTGPDTAPSTSVAPNPATSTTPPASLAPIGRGQSHNWSGYNATGGTFTAVSGTWSVPQPTGGSRYATGATWVGIGGVNTRDLIQAGTQETMGGAGQVRYSAWIEMLPQASRTVPLRVSPGDSVSVSITEKGTDNWLIVLKNNTTGQSYQDTVTYTSSLSSAEWIEEAPSAGGRRVLPLENFGSIQFTAGSAVENGKTVSISGTNAKPVTMIDSFGNPIAQPSVLGSDGNSFSVTRLNSSGSGAGTNPLSPFPSRILPGRGLPGVVGGI